MRPIRSSLMTLVAVVAAAWVVISSFLTWSTPSRPLAFYDSLGGLSGIRYVPSGEDLWQAAPLVGTVLVTSAVLVAVISPQWRLTRPVIWLAAVLAFLLAVIEWIHAPAYRSTSVTAFPHLRGAPPGDRQIVVGHIPSKSGAGEIIAASAGLALVIFACSLGRSPRPVPKASPGATTPSAD